MSSPSQLPPPPRTFRSRGLTFSQISIAVSIVLLAGFNVVLLVRLVILKHGLPVTVFVDNKEESHDLHGAGYKVNFHYESDGVTYNDSQHVEESEYESLASGQQYAGRAMRISVWDCCISEAGDPSTQTRSLAVAAGICDSGLVFIIVYLLHRRSRIRWLLREGEECQGTVLDRRMKLSRSSIKHFVKFRFIAGTLEVTKEDRVSRSAYKSAVIGDATTVFYNPADPLQCIAYNYCNYEIVAGGRDRPRISP